ncbi:MAG: amino acid ABC transporter permease [Tissierellia bacterium]|nr:amino acid ABC transporter permease [Tissierellia bacterium]
MASTGPELLLEASTWIRLFQGLAVTLTVSVFSVGLSMILGVILGVVMTSKNPVVHWVSQIYLEFGRLMPQLVLLFIVYFGFARTLGLHLSGFQAAVIVFTFWGAGEMADLVRGAITSIPLHQLESAASLSLSKTQIYRFVILPQAFRRLLPQAMNLVTRMIKTTSLIVLIGVVEVTKVAQQIIEAQRLTIPNAALWLYLAVLVLYFLLCFPLSKWAEHLEGRWSN